MNIWWLLTIVAVGALVWMLFSGGGRERVRTGDHGGARDRRGGPPDHEGGKRDPVEVIREIDPKKHGGGS